MNKLTRAIFVGNDHDRLCYGHTGDVKTKDVENAGGPFLKFKPDGIKKWLLIRKNALYFPQS